MFKAGSIRKIQVRNFVTYSHVEMYPGPDLNMLIGPNGTGKSTMVAAIILGLGGSPKIIGRGTRISEYVKHECDSATISVYLQDKQENSFIKITRDFDTQDKSTWKINEHRCSFGEVNECTKKFNIQVNNLCQFLPQDRVVDFAKLNKKELLRETQIALCRQDLIEKQNALIKAREDHDNLLQQANNHTQKLQEAQDANCRLEGKVKNFNKKLKFKERITHIDRKIAWILYEELRSKLTELKQDKAKAQEIFEKLRNEIKPMETEINAQKQNIVKFQQKNAKTMQNIVNIEENINTINEKINEITSKVRQIQDEINLKLSEIEQWDRHIEESVQKLQDLKKLQSTILAKENQQGDDNKHTISNEINKCTNCMTQLNDNKEQIKQTLSELKTDIRELQNEQTRIENIKQIKLDQLKRINSDAYTAVLWLRNNKHLFKAEIFEPIMLELSVLDKSNSKYLESIIPVRDRVAFTCTDKSDMSIFIQNLREQQGLSINVLHSGPSQGNYDIPNIPIERLRKYGFYTYVNTLFTAPEAIMKYLCQTYNLHNIPVGNAKTNDCYEAIPQQLRVFFSDKYRFAIKCSKYSGEKNVLQTLVKGDSGLSLSLDVVRLENIKGRCNDKKKNLANLQSKIENIDSQINKVEEKIRTFKEKLIAMQKHKQHIDSINYKIAAAEQNLNEERNNKKNPDHIREEGKNKIKKLINTMELLQNTLKQYFRDFESLITQSNLNSLKIECIRQKIESLTNEISDSKRKLRDAEETLNIITDKYTGVMQEAKGQLQKAKEHSSGFTPADQGFDQFRDVYDQLSSNTEELNSEKENLNSRIECLNTADDAEVQEYEDRQKLITSLTQKIDSTNTEINRISVSIDRMQEDWLTPLGNLISEINLRFASAFEKMGCAGEVAICKGNNEKNYVDYGISIKVTYRSGEPLQELNSTVQSGGERAVATAAFMLSLQELTPVPFRCVDEINQGMDANNERRIFELVVETCQSSTSQYFLITPKLVPNLQYSRQMLVHIVHNGPFINGDRKWNASKLCNPQNVHV